jgi:catechol 2,3-dioxygenase-like lactoylglutathione lyase family enzyme
MLTHIHPNLPMRDAQRTKAYYLDALGFNLIGDYGDYLFDSKTI